MKYAFKSGHLLVGKRPHILLGFGLFWLGAVCFAGTVSQSPLFLVAPVKPNIMFMLDNSGSMNNIVAEAPFVSKTTYLNCPAAQQILPCSKFGCVQIRVSGGAPQIFIPTDPLKPKGAGSVYPLGIGAGQRCFAPTGTYSALIYADNGNHTAPSFNTGDTDYSGNYLNWYFNVSNVAGSWVNGRKPGAQTRLEIAKAAGIMLIDSLSNVRVGLSAYYNYSDGGILLETVDDVDTVSTKKSSIKAKINALTASNNTPLAETLSDIGNYFTTGYSGNLTLHPGTANKSETIANIFTQGTKSDHNLYNSSGVSTIPAPIQFSCQKSFAVLMTDGRPHQDRDISASLRDYTGDCAAGLCDAAPTPDPLSDTAPDALPATPLTSTAFKNGTKVGRKYEWGGSDYLDDVAAALFDMDLRPDLVKATGDKNNLTTYTIGFADSTVANDPLLMGTAAKGGGLFISAESSTQLADAFSNIVNDISNQVKLGSGSILGANSTRLDTSSKIYQAGFKSDGWLGFLGAFALNTVSEDTNGNGVLEAGEDTNSNGVLDGKGSLGNEVWKAEDKIPVAGSRRILSYKPDPANTGKKGILFDWSSLSSSQKAALDPAATGASSDVLNFIRGDQSKEVKKGGLFRDRVSLLGDIVNSDPFFVGKTENFGYGSLPAAEGSDYLKFRTDPSYTNYKRNRTEAVYFGANDGMLHAINANTGDELFTYIPDAVIPKLSKLTNPKYGCTQSGCFPHEYFVDGSPRAGDAYFKDTPTASSTWHTVLLGTTGAGNGKSIFALDVSNPSSTIDADKVLWEISPIQAPDSADLNDVGTTKPGFANNLGYTIPQPSLVRLYDGSYAAVVANGYNSVNKKAVLFIIDVATGKIIRSFDTFVGNTTSPNGLSTPSVVDADGDRIADYIYAGDLLGNMWKLDVTDTNSANWGFAFGSVTAPLPLFKACSDAACANPQPITAKPIVGKNPEGGLMVYFGTGKYYEAGDQIVGLPAQVNTFYGIRDNGAVVSGKSELQQQTILGEAKLTGFSARFTSGTTVDYTGSSTVAAKKGWYMDLVVAPTNTAVGERVVSGAILRGGRLVFTTLLPSLVTCEPGGTSWLMVLDALNGSRLTGPSFDTDNNGVISSKDLVSKIDVTGDGVLDAIALSGVQENGGGIIKGVVVVSNGDGTENLDFGTSKGKRGGKTIGQDEPSGRQSWRQIR